MSRLLIWKCHHYRDCSNILFNQIFIYKTENQQNWSSNEKTFGFNFQLKKYQIFCKIYHLKLKFYTESILNKNVIVFFSSTPTLFRNYRSHVCFKSFTKNPFLCWCLKPPPKKLSRKFNCFYNNSFRQKRLKGIFSAFVLSWYTPLHLTVVNQLCLFCCHRIMFLLLPWNFINRRKGIFCHKFVELR